MTKPSEYKTDAEFIAVARERLARTLSNDRLPVQPWLREAMARLEATIPKPGVLDGGPCCPACGVPFDQHPGLIPTCRALQEARNA